MNNSYFESSLANEQGGEKGLALSFSSPNLTFLNNNFPIFVIKNNVISDFNIKDFCRILDNLNASPTSNFSASQEFHRIHHVNESMEILKYFIDYFHYQHEFMDIMNLMGGYKRRDKRDGKINN